MNVAPAPVMLAAILSPASAGAFAPGALDSPVCAWLPDGWHAATNSSVDSASAVVRKMDVFMWAPWGGASRLLGSAHGMMFLLTLGARRSEERRVGKACVSTCRSRGRT